MLSTHYVSAEGLQALKDELEHRTKVLRREISEKIGTAKDQGDISENFEYDTAKEEQAHNEARIIVLREMISRAVVTEKSSDNSAIAIGSTFVVSTDGGEEKTFSLVGSTEANPMEGKISNDSPLGTNFFGKSVGDKVEITIPAGTITYTIKTIS